MFRLNPALDRDRLRAEFARDRRVQILDFLHPEDAAALHAELKSRPDWRRIVNSGDNVWDLERETIAGFTPEQKEALDQAVYAGARAGFQYRYESVRVPDAASEREAQADILSDYASWLSCGEARRWLRDVTDFQGIDFADAQATAYSPGDFLTAHDDDVEGKGRFAAYVLNLTPQWRIEWGGLLLFHGDDGNVSHGIAPRFNSLNIFAVPQLHSVSEVTRAAPARRYSITGWLRSAAA